MGNFQQAMDDRKGFDFPFRLNSRGLVVSAGHRKACGLFI